VLLLVVLLSACGTKTYREVFHDAHPKAEILQEIKTQKEIVICTVRKRRNVTDVSCVSAWLE
jgi:hypothetical protein